MVYFTYCKNKLNKYTKTRARGNNTYPILTQYLPNTYFYTYPNTYFILTRLKLYYSCNYIINIFCIIIYSIMHTFLHLPNIGIFHLPCFIKA